MSNLKFNYEKMSTEELSREREIINELIAERHEKDKQTLLAEFHQRARTLGIDLTELVGGGRKSRGKKRGTVRPKYCHPDDPSSTWTGRGRKPKWVEKQLDAGKSLEDLLIEQPETHTLGS